MPLSPEREIYAYTPGDIVAVTHKRPLADIDLNFDGESTQHATHALHPYVAAINPPLARKIIDTYVPAKKNVLDPFCGGGGVLVEAILSGRNCAGFDINPLAVILSKSKTTWIDRKVIQSEYNRIITRTKALRGQIEPKISEQAQFWFKSETLPELAALSYAINEAEAEEVKNLFLAILSISIRSVMLTYRGEVRLRKLQGRDLENFRPDPLGIFSERSQVAIQQVPKLPRNCTARVEVADARNLPIKDEEYHSIICSPPYADDKNGVGYFQFSRYMLEWLGLTPTVINRHKNRFLGDVLQDKILPPSMTLQGAAANVQARSTQHYKEAVAFYADYYQALTEMKRAVTHWIIIIIGNRVLSRTLFDNANITLELFNAIGGIKFVDYYSRSIRKKRIPNLGADGGGISLEHILVFKKS
jgi:site-specific DNA-methyltransferase (cytosine-N4-specific)